MAWFGLFGHKRRPEEVIIEDLKKMGASIVADMKAQFMEVIASQRTELAKTQAQLEALQKTMENEKPVYVLRGSFFLHPRKRRGSMVIKCNSEEFLNRLAEIIQGDDNHDETSNVLAGRF